MQPPGCIHDRSYESNHRTSLDRLPDHRNLLVVCFVITIVVSLFTRPRPNEELRGLVYSLTEKETSSRGPWYSRPVPLGIGVLILTLLLNIIFW